MSTVFSRARNFVWTNVRPILPALAFATVVGAAFMFSDEALEVWDSLTPSIPFLNDGSPPPS